MQSILRLLLAGVLVLGVSLAGISAYGQGGATGAISGVVVDTSGGSVAGADVQIIDTRTDTLARKVPTSPDGAFVVPLLPPGTYRVVVNKAGFAQAAVANIEVRVTETTKLTLTLKPGAVTEKVEISAQVTTVETTTATTGQSIDSSTVRGLPLATQNFQQLLTLSTGAQSELNASAQLGRGDVRIIVNGQREDNNNYLIEGITATDYNVAELTNTPLPNPDVVQEFKVQTSLYDASQGRNGGGNVNAILKSGTKDFHGDAYEFFRNDVLNASDFFLNRAGQPRPVVKQNIFGVSAGGPIRSNATLGYFFGNYQGTRQRSGDSPGTLISTSIPVLPQQRDAGHISQAFFGNNTTPIDSVALALLQAKGNQFGGAGGGFLIPSIPGTPGQFAPFAFSRPGKYTDDQFTANWDREFRSAKDKVSSRFFFSDFESDLPFGAGGLTASLGGSIAPSDLNFPYRLPVHSRFFSVAETHLFSPTLVNEFRFGFVHINNSAINDPILKASDLGIDRPTNNVTQAIYKFTFFSSGFQIGPTPQADQFQTQNNYNFVDTVSWVKGAHTLRFGGDFTRVNLDKLFPQVFNGQLFFISGGGVTDFQNFLQGNAGFNFGAGGVFNHEYRQNNFSVFAQDDYKIRPNLTLNLGLRVEELGAFYDNLYHIGNVDPVLANKGQFPFIYPKGANSYKVPGLQGTANNTTLDNNYATGWGPRIGLAYDLFGKHTTTIRGGYGIYYVREDVGAVDQLSFQAPFLPVVFFPTQPGFTMANFYTGGSPAVNLNAIPVGGVLDPNFIPVFSHFQGFPTVGGVSDTTQGPIYDGTSVNLFALQVPKHFVVPNTQQWNLTLQRSLGKQWVLEVGYVGTHGVHLRETSNSLQSQKVTPSNPLSLSGPMCNPNPCVITENTIANSLARSRGQGINGYGGFELFADDAYSHYHSLQATVSRRWGAGYFQSAYTFSRSTDVASTGNTAFITIFNDQTNFQTSRGLSDFDRKHRLVVSYRYDLPFGKDATGFKKKALANWAISGITIFQSGLPFSVVDSAAGQAFVAATTVPTTASLAPGQSISNGLSSGSVQSRLNGYLNPSAFTPAPPLSAANGGDGVATDFGNLGRNTYRGPRQQNWDFSLIKNFKLTERQSLRFTTDFFNMWNHPVFANPSVTDVQTIPLGNVFGAIVATKGTPRLIQFSLRYAF